jgi:hypothetical protein
MRLVGLGLIALMLTGCSTTPPDYRRVWTPTTPISTKPGMSQDQLASIKVSDKDCPQINRHTNFAEEQLRLRGLTNVNPEDLNEEDRLYNATARILIWSLRIGCSNPNRYTK